MTLSSSPGDLVMFYALTIDDESQSDRTLFLFFLLNGCKMMIKNSNLFTCVYINQCNGMCSNSFAEQSLHPITALIVINTCDSSQTICSVGVDREIKGERY